MGRWSREVSFFFSTSGIFSGGDGMGLLNGEALHAIFYFISDFNLFLYSLFFPWKNEKCFSSGPGRDMFESVKMIGEKQYEKAKRLFDSANLKVSGPIGSVHQYVDMSSIVLQTNNGNVSTCKPAMGYSFAAGTTDGKDHLRSPPIIRDD